MPSAASASARLTTGGSARARAIATATSRLVRTCRPSPLAWLARCSSASSSAAAPSARRPRSSSARAASGPSGRRRNNVERLSNGGLTSKNGFSVVAPMRVTRPVSTPGSSASCCDFENRWTSSRNRIVPCPRSPRRWRARSSTSRTSFTPALTALSCSKALLVWAAMAWARVVLPVPGGPQRITDERRSASTSVRSGWPAPNSCSCPTMSSSVRGRRRAARGALAANESSAAEENRSSGMSPTVPHPPTQPTHKPLECISAPPPRTHRSPPRSQPTSQRLLCASSAAMRWSAHTEGDGVRVEGVCMAIEHVAKLDALVQVQHGLITSEQAIEVLGPSRKQRWVAERRLLSVQPGVF